MNEEEKYQPGHPPTPTELSDDVIISNDTRRENRIPPGQSRTRKWPVLHAGETPQITTESWRLEVGGLVDSPLEYDWAAYQQLPRIQVFGDMHCVTRWSRLGNLWEGVSTAEIIRRANVQSAAKFVVLHGYDQMASGKYWTTNLPLAEFAAADALLADVHDGKPISLDHGGPVRAMVPRLFAWKSAKWLKAIEFTTTDQPGFWESVGYHHLGDPWIVDGNHIDGQRFETPQNPPPGAN